MFEEFPWIFGRHCIMILYRLNSERIAVESTFNRTEKTHEATARQTTNYLLSNAFCRLFVSLTYTHITK